MRPPKIRLAQGRSIFFQSARVQPAVPGIPAVPAISSFSSNPLLIMWIQQQANSPASLSDLQGRSVGLKFECNHCHTEVFTALIGVPEINENADSISHAGNHEIEQIKCPGCDMTHEIEVDSTTAGVRFKISAVAPEKVSYQIAHI